MSHYVHRLGAIEAEANRFFESAGGNFGHTQVLAGCRRRS